MTWLDFFKKNFGLLIGLATVAFYTFMLNRKKKDGETIDSLNTELALNKAQLKVVEIEHEKEGNATKIKELQDDQKTIISKIQELQKQPTKTNLEDDQLADFLTKELNDENK